MNRREMMAGLTGAALACSTRASAAELKDDVAIVRRAMALHPGLYRYSTPAEVEARLEAFAPAYVQAPDLAARYLVLSRFLATIRCGHSYGNFFNQRKAVAAALFDRPTRLPFHFAWIDGRMVVTGDPSRLGLAPGSEVAAINGAPASAMLMQLMAYARADGHNNAKRVSLLGVSGSESIESFDVYHGLAYGTPEGGTHRLTVRAPAAAAPHRLEVPAIGLAARRAQRPPQPGPDQPAWTWSVRPDGVAVLSMPTWALYDSKWDWRPWLDERLDSLKGGRGLVIDLRDNEGGQDCGDEILARLIDRPLIEPGAERRVRFRRTPADLDPYLDTWDDSFRRLGESAEPIGNGVFRLTGERGVEAIAPRGPRITARVAALIGPADSSATFQFAAKARRSGRVRLFGEATGGNRRGINGGCFFFVRLPGSGLEFDLPLIGYFPPGRPPDAGLAPDVFVRRTPADIAAGQDRALEAAAAWVGA